MNSPLVSFCITCYNQERYIGEALDGAFAQTYRPLEIVISDDCSTDGTQDVIRRKIAEYKAAGGDIPVNFLANKENAGNLGNWLRFGEFAKGELIVKADGDDISLPERTSKVAKAWIDGGKKSKLISHPAIMVDGKRRSLGRTGGDRTGQNTGCCHSYSRDCWDSFARKSSGGHLTTDDVVFSRRTRLLGGNDSEVVVPEPLVYYRQGSGLTSDSSDFRRKGEFISRALINSVDETLADIECVKGRVAQENISAILQELADAPVLRRQLPLLASNVFTERLAALRSARWPDMKGAAMNLALLLPKWVGRPGSILFEMARRAAMLTKNGERLPLPDWRQGLPRQKGRAS